MKAMACSSLEKPEVPVNPNLLQQLEDALKKAVNNVISRRFIDYTMVIWSMLFSVVPDAPASSGGDATYNQS